MSDGVLVWRAWCLWPDSRIVKGILASCLCGSIGERLSTQLLLGLRPVLSGKHCGVYMAFLARSRLRRRGREYLPSPTLATSSHLHQRRRNSAHWQESLVRSLRLCVSYPRITDLIGKAIPPGNPGLPRSLCAENSRGNSTVAAPRIGHRVHVILGIQSLHCLPFIY